MEKGKCCQHCGKTYIKKNTFEKHIILCEIIHTTTDKERETNKLALTQRDLIKVIEHLVVKCNQLEAKVESMAKWVYKEKKKIKVVDWLQNQKNDSPYYPDFPWDNLLKHVTETITEKHMDIIKTHTFLDGLQVILEESFQNIKIPFCCFSETHDKFYMCETLEPLVWKECEKKTIVWFLNGLQKKLLFLLGEWKKNNRVLFEDDDRLCEQYNKTMMKMLISFSEEANYRKIKLILTHMTKMDVKHIVEYELENL